MRRITLVPAQRGRRFECFDCGAEIVAPFTLAQCPKCGEEENFHLMN